jgi:hypothetical protein
MTSSEKIETTARPPAQRGPQESCEPAHALGYEVAGRFVGAGNALPQKPLQPGPAGIGDEGLHAPNVAGDVFDQGRELADHDGSNQQDQHDECEHDQAYGGESRQRTVDSRAFQSRGKRIQHIGQRHRGHEGQQDLPQQPKHERYGDERGDPEQEVPVQRYPGDLAYADGRRLRRPGWRGGQRRASAELMWRTHPLT